ncbi:CDP-glycerol glycerophosphotransferase family protein [Bacillus sp. PS06]|uniref:CDP-glycerol glycerophosphotransferase family protein n=1 Tax=Bacillus sp. PS06 TaxID=2764176 RepID=UPI00177F3F2F|nr:CDP-glycerol glycerophosphotransferase family protein [Bacillus sp. PS06]MBD8070552.1 CDP-glycerol glycerophosphotransferase family protein [Bacillus sp. PS06]
MVKELIIGLYLLIFKVLFNFFKLFPLQNKVTFVVSFGENSLVLYEEMKMQDSINKFVFLKKSSCSYDLKTLTDAKVLAFETANLWDMICSIYQLASSKYIMIDNYYGFLSAIHFKKDAQCIQLWHAAGALKKFGLEDHSVKNRSKKAQNRFVNVYKKFDKVVVGSEEMANIFINSFGLPRTSILRTGIPRTDIFFDYELQQEIKEMLYSENPNLKNKKVLLYAPTYRDHELDTFTLQLDLEKMEKELGNDFVVLIKLHPAVKNAAKQYEKDFPNFVFDYSAYKNINHLLLITDMLITDYSSIPYEYSLLNKPMIFFTYDIDTYKEQRGLPTNYMAQIPGPAVYTTIEIIEKIKENSFDLSLVESFSMRWNRYSTGTSSKNLMSFLLNEEVSPKLEQQKQQQQVL